MNIRIMKISDYEAVFKLWSSCSGMGLNNLDDSCEGIERFLKRNPDCCFAAEANEKIIGVVMAGHDGRRGIFITWQLLLIIGDKRSVPCC